LPACDHHRGRRQRPHPLGGPHPLLSPRPPFQKGAEKGLIAGPQICSRLWVLPRPPGIRVLRIAMFSRGRTFNYFTTLQFLLRPAEGLRPINLAQKVVDYGR
jgi:hypothetical protein